MLTTSPAQIKTVQPAGLAARWARHGIVAAILAVIVGGTFSNSFRSGMVLDNKYIIEEYYKYLLRADASLDPQSWRQIGMIVQNDYWWPKGISGLYRPITTFTYWLDYVWLTPRPPQLDAAGKPVVDEHGNVVPMPWRDYALTPWRKLNTTSYHWINLVLHWFNSLLVYGMGLLLLRRFVPAALVAALFASHPITTESVTNIIGRADMFAAAATFGGLLVYARSQRDHDTRALPWLVGLALICFLGVFSKESAAALGLVMLVYDIAYRWRADDERNNAMLMLMRNALMFALALLIPLFIGSIAEVFGLAAAIPVVPRIVLGLCLICAGVLHHLWDRMQHEIRLVPLIVLFAAASLASILIPYFPLVPLLIVGVVEFVLGCRRFSRAGRVGELPLLIGHGLLYLLMIAAVAVLPSMMAWLAMKKSLGNDMSWVVKILIAAVPMAVAVGQYVAFFRGARKTRLISLAVFAVAMSLAALLLPKIVPAIVAVVAAVELVRGSLTSDNPRYRVVAHAALYLLLFFALLGLPIATLILFHQKGWNPWYAAWLRFGVGGLALAAGVLLSLLTSQSSRPIRVAALVGVAILCVTGSFFTYWAGILLALAVATHEVLLGSLLSRETKFRSDWKLVWNGFAIGYLMLIPALLAMFFVRDWVFRNSSPPETPFLDNPIRGIWQVAELNIPDFQTELKEKPLLGLSFVECKLTAVKVMGKLMLLLTWPGTLSSDYSYSEIPNFSWHLSRWEDWKAIVALATLAGIGVVAAKMYKKNQAAFFFILLFFAAALPTSNFIITIGSIMAERFMYLPLAGFTGVVVIAAFAAARKLNQRFKMFDQDDFPWHHAVAGALLCVMVMAYGVRGFFRNYAWESDYTLWTAAKKASPLSFRCYQSLAFAIYERFGEQASQPGANLKAMEPQVDEMIEVAEGGLPIVGVLPRHLNSGRLYLHLGMYYSIKGDLLCERNNDGSMSVTAQALPWYTKAVDVLESGSQIDRAFNQVNQAKQHQRGDPPEKISDAGLGPIYSALGAAYSRLGRYDMAKKKFEYQRQLEPTDVESYLKLGTTYLALRKPDEMAVAYIQAALIDASRPDVWIGLNQYFSSRQDGAGALIEDHGQIKLNVSHPVVRMHLCSAYRDLIRVLRWSRRFDVAKEARSAAVDKYGFPPSLFDPLFDEPIYPVTPDGIQYAHPIEPPKPAKIEPLNDK